jgi:predicted ATPase
MQADREQSHWIVWKCQPRQRGVSLHPATEFLRGILSAPGDGALAVAELANYLARWEVGTPENVAALASLLELPPGRAEEPARLRREIEALTVAQRWERCRRVVLEWLQRVSRDAPAALVVEDLQWVDPVTLALLQELVDRGPRERMLTVLSFRPEFETPWGSRSYQTQVALGRLTRSQAATIHAHVTGVVAPHQETLVRMMAVSGGNPLSVEAFALLDLATVGRAERRGLGESHDLPASPS